MAVYMSDGAKKDWVFVLPKTAQESAAPDSEDIKATAAKYDFSEDTDHQTAAYADFDFQSLQPEDQLINIDSNEFDWKNRKTAGQLLEASSLLPPRGTLIIDRNYEGSKKLFELMDANRGEETVGHPHPLSEAGLVEVGDYAKLVVHVDVSESNAKPLKVTQLQWLRLNMEPTNLLPKISFQCSSNVERETRNEITIAEFQPASDGQSSGARDWVFVFPKPRGSNVIDAPENAAHPVAAATAPEEEQEPAAHPDETDPAIQPQEPVAGEVATRDVGEVPAVATVEAICCA
ncbi:unnamed protein product [Amoebophrya sp. A25]|nr:unnamed protein product [Amoebophrya sp. A25]|eukprot:GSA25T00026872001.1